MVIAEIVWVLESYYELTNVAIAPPRPRYTRHARTGGNQRRAGRTGGGALRGQGIDFIDGYIAAVMEKQGIDELYSFDRKHISRIRNITRKEP